MSTRDLSVAVEAAIQEPVVRAIFFFEAELVSSQFLRLWTGVGVRSWDGHDWTGGGNLLTISSIEESVKVSAVPGFQVSISGLPSSNISLALQSVRQGLPGRLLMGVVDEDNVLLSDPYVMKEGRFDVIVIDDDGVTCTIQVTYESRMIDLNRTRERRYTNEDQHIDFPDDDGFEYVPSIQDMQLIWGGPLAAASPVTPVASTDPAISGGDWGGDGGTRGRSLGDG